MPILHHFTSLPSSSFTSTRTHCFVVLTHPNDPPFSSSHLPTVLPTQLPNSSSFTPTWMPHFSQLALCTSHTNHAHSPCRLPIALSNHSPELSPIRPPKCLWPFTRTTHPFVRPNTFNWFFNTLNKISFNPPFNVYSNVPKCLIFQLSPEHCFV